MKTRQNDLDKLARRENELTELHETGILRRAGIALLSISKRPRSTSAQAHSQGAEQTATVRGYSLTQIALHWTIAAGWVSILFEESTTTVVDVVERPPGAHPF